MKDVSRSKPPGWDAQQPQDAAGRAPTGNSERRGRADRRRRAWWSVLYGSFNPRRRSPARRLGDSRFHPVDWHSPHLLAVSIGILLLSATDAFLTFLLLQQGADEVNPIMAALIYRSVAVFASSKMALTGASIMVMVFLARYRFMRRIRVELVLYAVLLAYAWLIGYEIWMLKGQGQLPLL
jgi:hypothetical protein